MLRRITYIDFLKRPTNSHTQETKCNFERETEKSFITSVKSINR